MRDRLVVEVDLLAVVDSAVAACYHTPWQMLCVACHAVVGTCWEAC